MKKGTLTATDIGQLLKVENYLVLQYFDCLADVSKFFVDKVSSGVNKLPFH